MSTQGLRVHEKEYGIDYNMEASQCMVSKGESHELIYVKEDQTRSELETRQ